MQRKLKFRVPMEATFTTAEPLLSEKPRETKEQNPNKNNKKRTYIVSGTEILAKTFVRQ